MKVISFDSCGLSALTQFISQLLLSYRIFNIIFQQSLHSLTSHAESQSRLNLLNILVHFIFGSNETSHLRIYVFQPNYVYVIYSNHTKSKKLAKLDSIHNFAARLAHADFRTSSIISFYLEATYLTFCLPCTMYLLKIQRLSSIQRLLPRFSPIPLNFHILNIFFHLFFNLKLYTY